MHTGQIDKIKNVTSETNNEDQDYKVEVTNTARNEEMPPSTKIDNKLPGTLSVHNFKKKKPEDMAELYLLRPFSAYILQSNPKIFYLLYKDNLEYVVQPNESSQKYLQESPSDIKGLLQTSVFSELQGNDIDWTLFM